MSEQGIRDFRQAKLKAAERLGIFDEASLPRNAEIEDALREHQRLFGGAAQTHTLQRLRRVARDAMVFFAAFEPRLVGAVLEGTADAHSAVCLHLYCDDGATVEAHLRERAIPYEATLRKVRFDRDTAADMPVMLFSADDAAIDITVLPFDVLRQAPIDRVHERPMQRASLLQLDALLDEASGPGDN